VSSRDKEVPANGGRPCVGSGGRCILRPVITMFWLHCWEHDMKLNNLIVTAVVAVVSVVSFANGASAQSTPATRRVWSINEVMLERKFLAIAKKPRYCSGGAFKPCVCAQDVPSIVQYRPAVAECGGKAAIVLSGKYKDVFSVVVRDAENKDRWPVNGINGCTPYETDVLGLNKCSAFKVQKEILVEDKAGDATVNCLGASGYSSLFRRVRRMTAKLSDVPNSSADPLARWCLKGPDVPLN